MSQALTNNHFVRKKGKSTLTLVIAIVVIFSICSFIMLYFHFKPSDSASVLSSKIKTKDSRIEYASYETLDVNDEWKKIPLPGKSHFGFDYPPRNKLLWERAKSIASKGTPVLLSQILQQFDKSGYLDFLDGDTFFKKLYTQVDAFMHKTNADDIFRILSNYSIQNSIKKKELFVQKYPPTVIKGSTDSNGKKQYAIVDNAQDLTPDVYNYTMIHRAPIVSVGYHIFEKDVVDNTSHFLNGIMIGSAHYMKRDFIEDWSRYSSSIATPYIIVQVVSENFGTFSGNFPNRTSPKYQWCCPKQPKLMELLNHKNTLLFVANQFNNFSHPKVLTLPLGIKMNGKHTLKLLRDTMIYSSQYVKKKKLLISASSNWYTRPQILSCIQKKVSTEDFEIIKKNTPEGEFTAQQGRRRLGTYRQRSFYFQKLASAKFVLGVPGLGYDCYRNWEALTMGSVLVTERGVGLDRTFWRLPVLLVEDFAEITTPLLRSAYVEAVYRTLTKQFEFERLTQSFWWSVLNNVSLTRSNNIILEKFPMRAEDTDFTRPWIPYDCGRNRPMTCGKGTKRIPVESC